MAEIKNKTTASGETVYDSLNGAAMVFHGFAGFDVRGYDVVLKGAHGKMRDHIIPLHKAVEKYYAACRLCASLVKAGTRGWDELADILHDFRAKIGEATSARLFNNIPVEEDVLSFVDRAKEMNEKTSIAQVMADLQWKEEQDRVAALMASLKAP